MERILDPRYYRIKADARSVSAQHNHITLDTVDDLLDAGSLEVAMMNGRWWTIRRNGKTLRKKRDVTDIRIPWKAGLRVYGAITQSDFVLPRPEPEHYPITLIGDANHAEAQRNTINRLKRKPLYDL